MRRNPFANRQQRPACSSSAMPTPWPRPSSSACSAGKLPNDTMRQDPSLTGRLEACEAQRKLELPCLPHRSHRRHRPRKGGSYVLALTLLVAPLGAVGYTDAEPRSVHQVEGSPAHAPAAAGEEEHAGRGVVDILARIVNFGILAGTLFYLLRSPLRTYLGDRATTIRSDLVNAAEMKKTAAAQIEEIDRRMKALPGE